MNGIQTQKQIDALKRAVTRLTKKTNAQAKRIKLLEERPPQVVAYRSGGNA